MLKELRNNFIVIIIGFVIVLISFLIYFNVVNSAKGYSELTFEDNDIAVLENELYLIEKFRGFYNIGDSLDNLHLLQYALDSLEEGDYSLQSIDSKKNNCKITDKVNFASSDKCDVITISNEKIKSILSSKLMINQEITFVNIQYKNMDCKNDGENYYCLLKAYKSNINDYSLVKDIYEKDGKVIIRDYYFKIDVSNKDICSKYYDDTYCSNYIDALKPELSEEILEKEGLLYEVVFGKNDEGYFLESISII